MLQILLRSAAIAAAVVVFVVLTSCNIGNQTKTEKWEYKIVMAKNNDGFFIGYDYSDQEYVNIMNSLGEDGWEFVSLMMPDRSSVPFFYFKRRLP